MFRPTVLRIFPGATRARLARPFYSIRQFTANTIVNVDFKEGDKISGPRGRLSKSQQPSAESQHDKQLQGVAQRALDDDRALGRWLGSLAVIKNREIRKQLLIFFGFEKSGKPKAHGPKSDRKLHPDRLDRSEHWMVFVAEGGAIPFNIEPMLGPDITSEVLGEYFVDEIEDELKGSLENASEGIMSMHNDTTHELTILIVYETLGFAADLEPSHRLDPKIENQLKASRPELTQRIVLGLLGCKDMEELSRRATSGDCFSWDSDFGDTLKKIWPKDHPAREAYSEIFKARRSEVLDARNCGASKS